MSRFRLMVVARIALIGIPVFVSGPPGANAAPDCVAPRFVPNAGWVTDLATKLVWQQTFASARTWAAATDFCKTQGAGARLPSVKELITIVDETKRDPAIDIQAFPATPADRFWTSSVVSGSSGLAWLVNFLSGSTGNLGVTNTSAVRCVR